MQIKDTFESVYKQKLSLQLENEQLRQTVRELEEKFRRLKLNSEDTATRVSHLIRERTKLFHSQSSDLQLLIPNSK